MNKQRIYLFLKNYGQERYVKLYHIQKYADSLKIPRTEMGAIIQDLKKNDIIYFIPMKGWRVKTQNTYPNHNKIAGKTSSFRGRNTY